MDGLFERLLYKIKAQFVSAHTEDGKFKDLKILLERATAEANSEFGMLLYNSKVNQSEKGGKGKKQFLKSTAKSHFVCSAQKVNQQPPFQAVKLCTFCQDLHHIWKCSKFKELSKRHNTLLHFKSKQNNKSALALKGSVSDEETCSSNSIASAKNICDIYLKVSWKIFFQGRASKAKVQRPR